MYIYIYISASVGNYIKYKCIYILDDLIHI